MLEATGDIFNVECDAVCITTNGFIKKNGEAVMGKGCALKAAQLVPKLPIRLAYHLKLGGNKVYKLTRGKIALVSFPVKPAWREYNVPEDAVSHMRNRFHVGQQIPGWASTAIPKIIIISAHQLVELTDREGWSKVVLPRPGCGAGELEWSEIKPLIEKILDDRFVCMTY